MKSRLSICVLITFFLPVLPAYAGLTEVFGVYRHLSRAELLEDFKRQGIRPQSSEKSQGLEKLARDSFVRMAKELLQSTDPTLKVKPETWPVEVFVFDRSPDGTEGLVSLLVGYCGNRQVFVMPIFSDNRFRWSDVVRALDSKYKRLYLRENNGMWDQSSAVSLGKTVRTILAVKTTTGGISAVVFYFDALNIMSFQVDLNEKERQKRRGF